MKLAGDPKSVSIVEGEKQGSKEYNAQLLASTSEASCHRTTRRLVRLNKPHSKLQQMSVKPRQSSSNKVRIKKRMRVKRRRA